MRPRRTFDDRTRSRTSASCEGYRVDGAEGRIGFVDDVRGDDEHRVLAVRAGVLGRRVLLVRGEDVAFIVPPARRIWLRAPATIVGSGAAS